MANKMVSILGLMMIVLVTWTISTWADFDTGENAYLNEDFAIADSERSYWEKLEAYEQLADKHLQKDEFAEFKESQLGHLDEVMWELAQSPEFDRTIVDPVRVTFPDHEWEQFIAHFRGLLRHWVESNPE